MSETEAYIGICTTVLIVVITGSTWSIQRLIRRSLEDITRLRSRLELADRLAECSDKLIKGHKNYCRPSIKCDCGFPQYFDALKAYRADGGSDE